MDAFGKGGRKEGKKGGGRLFKIPVGNEESLIEDAGRNAFSRAELVLFLTHICTLHRQGRRPCHSVHSRLFFFGEPEAVSARRVKEDVVNDKGGIFWRREERNVGGHHRFLFQ